MKTLNMILFLTADSRKIGMSGGGGLECIYKFKIMNN